MKYMSVTILRVDGIGNMVSIEGLKETIKDGMLKCDYGNSYYKAYREIYRLLSNMSGYAGQSDHPRPIGIDQFRYIKIRHLR